tara:strand:+ start:136 stop:1539 length:1404 start_codon:yes stop_codon:yes gene_type:complete
MEINKLIELIGGYKALSEILNVSKSAISNYKKRGSLPSYAIPIIVEVLKSKGIFIDISEFTKVKQNTNLKTILMIICGGISAYKAPEIIRRLKQSGFRIIPVITKGGSKFITPLTLSSVAEEKCYSDLFNLTDESEMGHIKLARIADLILIAPASANFISKVANGISDDLATTIILATKAPIYICPAMNPSMWSNDIIKNNVQSLEHRGFQFIGPDEGLSACGEFGYSRLSEISNIIDFITNKSNKKKVLDFKNKKVLVTAGPTIEAIDEVRYISNHSSGKQGYLIAQEFANHGAEVTLVSGPVGLKPPNKVNLYNVDTADEMLEISLKCLPVDIAIFVAAVADWKVEKPYPGKIKKKNDSITLNFERNPDILQYIANHKMRPSLVVGFSAETEKIIENSRKKLIQKGCDWILGNEVGKKTGVFGSDRNQIIFISEKNIEKWPKLYKSEVAVKLLEKVRKHFKNYND